MISRKADIINLYYRGESISYISETINLGKKEIIKEILNERIKKIRSIVDFNKLEEEKIEIEKFIIETIIKVDRIKDKNRRLEIINIIKLIDNEVTYENISKIAMISKQRISQLMKKYAEEYEIIRAVNSINTCSKCGKKGKSFYKISDQIFWCKNCKKKEIDNKKKKWSVKYNKCQDCGTTSIKHNSHGRCKKCISNFLYHYDLKRREGAKKSGKKWYEKNIEKIKKHNQKYHKKHYDLKNFGGNREKAIFRDKEKCQKCGFFGGKEHKGLKVIHLKDKNDHSLDNLLTICQKCFLNILREKKSEKLKK